MDLMGVKGIFFRHYILDNLWHFQVFNIIIMQLFFIKNISLMSSN